MKAAVIREYGQTPAYGDFADPVAEQGEVVVEVVATGLHQLVRGQASGAHYSSAGGLPQVVGADGVARLADGRLAWFGGVRKPFGTMAELAPVREGGWTVLPDGADPAQVAGQVNPAMSAWLALTVRAHLEPGQNVLVLGATGASGRQAVQIAKHLGAAHVTALGRNPEALEQLREVGADHLIRLDEDGAPASPLADPPIDVVLDYLWGTPVLRTMAALLDHRADPGRPLTLVQIGSMAGRETAFPATALRSHNLRVIGSGLGSTPMADMAREMPRIVEQVAAGIFGAPIRRMPLSDIEHAWSAEVAPSERIVLLP